jgi:hypothetical protein
MNLGDLPISETSYDEARTRTELRTYIASTRCARVAELRTHQLGPTKSETESGPGRDRNNVFGLVAEVLDLELPGRSSSMAILGEPKVVTAAASILAKSSSVRCL